MRKATNFNNVVQSFSNDGIEEGIIEVLHDGYGFLHTSNFLPGNEDIYVSSKLIRMFHLRTGDIIRGSTTNSRHKEKFRVLQNINSINDLCTLEAANRLKFEELTPIYPDNRIQLEGYNSSVSLRIIDLFSPIGKGQRGIIASQPKAGKTTIIKEIAKSIKVNHPEMHVIIMLIDERPEEVTDIKDSLEDNNIEVKFSTFDENVENHIQISEMVLERAKRLMEHKKDVIIILDSLTRLARAYNLAVKSSGRTLTGGLDPVALCMPKRFFGAARNVREGGSLTILATALIDTGSMMDNMIFEEFKGTGNMELMLDRELSEMRIFPSINGKRQLKQCIAKASKVIYN